MRGADSDLNGAAGEAENETGDSDKEAVVEGVDVWVTSEKFLLYNPTASAGISVSYPSISLHAIQRLQLPGASPESGQVQGLYMQIATSPGADGMPGNDQDEDEEEHSITMTLVPPPQNQAGAEDTAVDEDQLDKPAETPTQMLYDAVSACSNLHPDPGVDEDDNGAGGLLGSGLVGAGVGDGGLPPPVEGSSGWITAENMHEFFDDEGNWIAGGEEPTLPLGPGAGTVRERESEDEDDGGNQGAENAEGQSDETKWRRTD
ncbi:hypothetical protein PHISP_08118 [Aspergillus sp. HF37]|nr:hypothetical protein PHISP_08118 [Aspergillus sp. HF37]